MDVAGETSADRDTGYEGHQILEAWNVSSSKEVESFIVRLERLLYRTYTLAAYRFFMRLE